MSQTRERGRIAALRARGFVHDSVERRRPTAAEERLGYGTHTEAVDAPVVPLEAAFAAATPAVVGSRTGTLGEAAATRGEDDVRVSPSAAEALEELSAALDKVQAVDWDAEAPEAAAGAPVTLQRLCNRLASAQIDSLGSVDRRGLHGLDGSVSVAAWFRNRSGIDHGAASRLVSAARRLPLLPALADALAVGEVSLAHVTAITSAAVPTRQDGFVAADATLTELARSASPNEVRQAARFLADQVDPDGSQPKPAAQDWTGRDSRRHYDLWETVDDLLDGRHLLDRVDGELLRTLLDAHDVPDPEGTPEHLRRSAGQRRADAFVRILHAAAAAKDAPTIQGNPPQLLGMFDLARWLGFEDRATFDDQLRHGGPVNLATMARLIDVAAVTIVLTWGPWRVVNVGRTHRTLPPWLRPMLHMLHRRCRGPDCDRPATWTQAHHQDEWQAGGETDLNKTIPLCQAHHTLVTSGGWAVRLDLDTGACIWTTPNGRTITTRA